MVNVINTINAMRIIDNAAEYPISSAEKVLKFKVNTTSSDDMISFRYTVIGVYVLKAPIVSIVQMFPIIGKVI